MHQGASRGALSARRRGLRNHPLPPWLLCLHPRRDPDNLCSRGGMGRRLRLPHYAHRGLHPALGALIAAGCSRTTFGYLCDFDFDLLRVPESEIFRSYPATTLCLGGGEERLPLLGERYMGYL